LNGCRGRGKVKTTDKPWREKKSKKKNGGPLNPSSRGPKSTRQRGGMGVGAYGRCGGRWGGQGKGHGFVFPRGWGAFVRKRGGPGNSSRGAKLLARRGARGPQKKKARGLCG